MTAVTRTEPNPEFSRLATDEQITRAVAALGPNGIATTVVATAEQARRHVLELIPEGAEVLTGLSRTLEIIGLAAEIDEFGRYDAVRPKLQKLDYNTQRREMRKLAGAPDYAVGSVHAITEDGVVFTGSGSGSQIAAYAYAASNVIWVAGAQKIVPDRAAAMRRLEEYSLPLEKRTDACCIRVPVEARQDFSKSTSSGLAE